MQRVKEEYYLSFDQVTMPLAINFLIVQKHTVLDSWAHEMIITGTGSEAAAYCGTWLLAELTPLQKQKEKNKNLFSSKTKPPLLLSVGFFWHRQKFRVMLDLLLHCCSISLQWLTHTSERHGGGGERKKNPSHGTTFSFLDWFFQAFPRLSCLCFISSPHICKLHLVSTVFLNWVRIK